MTTRIRDERIEFRTTSELRLLVDRAIKATGGNLTDSAEASLTLAAQRVLADREQFTP